MSINRVHRSRSLVSGLLAGMLVLGGLLGNAQAAPITLPYYETFTPGTTLGDYPDFTFTSPASNWSISSGSLFFNIFTGGQQGSAAVQVSAPVTLPLTVSTEFHLDNASLSSDVGLALFGSTATFGVGAGQGSHYLVDFKPRATASTSNMRILKLVNGAVTDIVSTTALPLFALNDTYRLTAEATPVGATLDLTFTLQNLTTMAAPSTFSGNDATPLTGTYFGIRNRSSVNGSFQILFHDLSMSVVPEPSSFGLLAMGLVGLRYFRRRKV